MGMRPRVGLAAAGVVAAALAVTLAACTSHASGDGGPSGTVSGTRTVIVGTSTVTSTDYVTGETLTVLPVSPTTVPPVSTAPVDTVTGPPDTVTGPPDTTTAAASTTLPAAQVGECPYISAEDVKNINGQHYGPTSIIPVKPYPICIFTRSDGGYLATTRIVVAATPAAAVAVVNSYVPVEASFPVNDPAGWSGGAMSLPHGNADNPKNQSIYAVSKATIAIIAESNQLQSVKGRQMVEQIVKNMGW